MANLTAPNIDWGGPEPQSQGSLVPSANLMPASSSPIYTGGILSAPAANQLVPPAPTPDAGLFVWQKSAVDGAGNILTDARVDVRFAETNGVAEIFADRDGVTRKQNPFLVDSEGFAQFYAAAGLYNITVTRAGLERVYENVLLGLRLEDMPDLTSRVTPIVEALLETAVDEVNAALDDLPDLVKFQVSAAGVLSGAPATYSSTRLSAGRVRVTHGRSTSSYHVDPVAYDPLTDRLFSVMLEEKNLNDFVYRVKSIQDETSDTDAVVDIELSFFD